MLIQFIILVLESRKVVRVYDLHLLGPEAGLDTPGHDDGEADQDGEWNETCTQE